MGEKIPMIIDFQQQLADQYLREFQEKVDGAVNGSNPIADLDMLIFSLRYVSNTPLRMRYLTFIVEAFISLKELELAAQAVFCEPNEEAVKPLLTIVATAFERKGFHARAEDILSLKASSTPKAGYIVHLQERHRTLMRITEDDL